VFIFNTHFVWAGSVMSVLLQLAGLKGLMVSQAAHCYQQHLKSIGLCVCLFACCLTAFSAQIGYIVS